MNISTILAPLKALFQNKTFDTMLVGAIASVAVGLVPSFAQYQETVVSLVVVLMLIAAGGEVVQNALKTTTQAKVEMARIQLQIAQTQAVAKTNNAPPIDNYTSSARG